jgi:hypothetical protein
LAGWAPAEAISSVKPSLDNAADWIIAVDAALDPAMDEEPLLLHFALDGRGFGIVQQVRIDAHMDTGGSTYGHPLSLLLEEGATKSFGVEGWRDYMEWTVVLHLK